MNDWMKQNFYCFIDFETTGVPAEEHYSIQIGMIFTDSKFQVLETFKSFIGWEELIKAVDANDLKWGDRFQDAEQYHKISAEKYVYECAKNEYSAPFSVVSESYRLMRIIREDYGDADSRFILISDNIQFEWQLLRKLYKESSAEWPFHYCGWDTSMLLCTVGTGDPENPPHDALLDASGLHLAVVRSLEKTGFFND